MSDNTEPKLTETEKQEIQWALKAQQGDQDALASLWSALQPWTRAEVLKNLPADPQLTQDANVKALMSNVWNKLIASEFKSYDPAKGSTLRAWAAVVVKNIVFDWLKVLSDDKDPLYKSEEYDSFIGADNTDDYSHSGTAREVENVAVTFTPDTARQTFGRRSAVRQHERRSRAGIFLRRYQ